MQTVKRLYSGVEHVLLGPLISSGCTSCCLPYNVSTRDESACDMPTGHCFEGLTLGVCHSRHTSNVLLIDTFVWSKALALN